MRKAESNVAIIERRKHWRDRRVDGDRRNPERLLHAGEDCRQGSPRRISDISGDSNDGEVWWQERRQHPDSY